ncbi:MAG: 3TM-type holin [Allorhizobium sp.]
MSAVASILIGVAAKVGAPIVKGLLQDYLGGTAGQVGGAVIDAIAERAGVPIEQLPDLPEHELEAVVKSVEADSPALINALLESQREANKLMLAEMQKETAFGWLWRPAGMWLMLACVAWLMMVRPVLNAILWGIMPGIQIEVGIDIANFLGIFTIYTGFYMGGNTILRGLKK